VQHRPPSSVATGNAAKPSAAVPQSTDGFDDISGKPVFTQFGVASWYGPPYHNHAGADGTIFDQNAMTAAHRTLPMGSTVRVTNTATNQSILVRVTDRGPFVPGRVLDLSMAAAKAIGVWRPGTAQVKIEAYEHPNNDPAGRWCVQIGAFKNSDDALDLQASLMQRYKGARVIEFTGPTGHWVRVDPSQHNLSQANEVARSIETADPSALPYVVRLD
jgi:rare lipoprotein A